MSKTKIPPAPRWDLEPIFPGGSGSPEFRAHMDGLKADFEKTEKLQESLPDKIATDNVSPWADFVVALQKLFDDYELAGSFAGCLVAADVDDDVALAQDAECDLMYSRWRKLKTALEARSLKQSDEQWQILLDEPRLSGVTFFLNELKEIAASKLSLELETLALELGVNGYDGWQRLYDKMAGDIKVDFEVDGKTEKMSIGQVAAKMSDNDRDVRRRAFAAISEGWSRRENLAALALNSIAGFRWTMYDKRGWTSPLHESLVMNRIQQETLDAMWSVIRRETHRFRGYIDTKKRLLGIDKFTWYDQMAPVGKSDTLMSFDDAGKFVVEQARGFSTHMADFMQEALEKRWIEGEDRPGKRGGGFCTGFGPRQQSRIFMTYSGTFENMLTLAHELGHAYHGRVLKDHPPFAADYPMNLAETASIFAETLVVDAAYKRETDPQTKLMLIEQKLQSAFGLFCDIHCRYLFEKEFYMERRNGIISADRLKEMMTSAQERTFPDLLDEGGFNPLFWASKLHFYIANQPFYNWPYTFGYLFAGGVYDRAQKEGTTFADKYRDLLADTGRMTTEEVASKHLGVDLTKEDFWIDAVNRSMADIDEFIKLAQ
jgi:pepF/M3 family oligoendopeptidase